MLCISRRDTEGAGRRREGGFAFLGHTYGVLQGKTETALFVKIAGILCLPFIGRIQLWQRSFWSGRRHFRRFAWKR